MVDEFIIRQATRNDMEDVFHLSNDETVRANSINPKKIDWEEHCIWFQEKLCNELCRYFIAKSLDGDFIGQVRFDFKDTGWITGISISPTFRGRGLAPKLLKKAFALAHLDEAVATVREDNTASQKSFERAGYKRISSIVIEEDVYQIWRKKLPVFVIAEMSANHCGDMELAKKIIFSAKECGADAVKIQTYTADTLTIDCKNKWFKISGGTLWDEKYLYNLYKEAYTPWEWQKELKEYADSVGIELFSTPFDNTAVDFLESIGVKKYKIASFEAIDIPLIEYTASKGKPIIVSTGICSESEINEIIVACKRVGNHDITLLKCTSAYPAKPEDMNLLTIPDMKKKFGVKVGLSDHTMEIETTVAGVALGVAVIEKHFTLDRSLGGADATFSLNPQELKLTVEAIRKTEKLLGGVDYSINEKNRRFARSLFICADIRKGELFTAENVRSIRPGYGCPPNLLPAVLGQRANRDLAFGTPMSIEYMEN